MRSFPKKHALLAALVALACRPASSASIGQQPQLVYDLQSQRPPVARVNQSFAFTLLPGTFSSSPGSQVVYSAQALPSWASFDPSSQTFSGTPRQGDEGSDYVYVTANSSSNSQGTTNGFHLLVVDDPPPYVKLPLTSQTPAATVKGDGSFLQRDGTLRVPPNWSFSLGFEWYTISAANGAHIYYTAFTRGSTGLPFWLKFDNNTVTFDGVAPDHGTYIVDLVGSDHFGYGDVKQSFTLIVSSHSFELLDPLPAINATARDQINYTVPISGIQVDNSTVSASNVSVSVDLSAFKYLSFDPATRQISGTLPDSLPDRTDLIIPVNFTDRYNDTLPSNITLHVTPNLFTNSTLPNLYVQSGKQFAFDIHPYIASHQATYTASFDPDSASAWMTFDQTSLSLQGTPPEGSPDVKVSFMAHDPTTEVVIDTATMVVTEAPPPSTSPNSPGSSPTSFPTGSPDSSSGTRGALTPMAKVAIGATLGCAGGIFLLILLMICCRRHCSEDGRRRAEDGGYFRGEKPAAPTPYTGSIEKPSPAHFGQRHADDADIAVDNAVTVANLQAKDSKPKRLDLMRIFARQGSGSQEKEEKDNEAGLYGLGIAGTPPPGGLEIVTVGDPEFHPDPEEDEGTEDGEEDEEEGSGSERSRSSWESKGTSSIFYSEGEGEGGEGGPSRSSRSLPQAGTSASGSDPDGNPPSVPRQRRDFMRSPVIASNTSPSPSRPGVRLITKLGGPRASGGSDVTSGSLHFAPLAEAAIAKASVQKLEDPVAKPKLIDFTPSRHVKRSSTPAQRRFASQKAIPDGVDPDSVADAEETPRHSTSSSVPYSPPGGEGDCGSPTTSAIFFSTPTEAFRSPAPLLGQEGEWRREGIRLVHGTTSPRQRTDSRPPTRPTHRRTLTSGSIPEPVRIRVTVGEPFHFTPSLHPPPSVSISSPGRNGPPRTSHFALTDNPDEPANDRRPLPEWLHFDVPELEFWGIPRPQDHGAVNVQVIEKRNSSSPLSPRQNSEDSTLSPRLNGGMQGEEVEQVVGRFILDVQPREAPSTDAMEVNGGLQVVTF